jgi:Zn-dependent M28 family amino/carboxypeptidase
LINLDGFSSSLCKQNFLETTPQAKDFALSIAKELAWPVHHAGYPMPLSDHIPFIEAGVPVIWIHEGLIDPYYHTEGDTIDHIDFEKLARITRVAGHCASTLAGLDKLPF